MNVGIIEKNRDFKIFPQFLKGMGKTGGTAAVEKERVGH